MFYGRLPEMVYIVIAENVMSEDKEKILQDIKKIVACPDRIRLTLKEKILKYITYQKLMNI